MTSYNRTGLRHPEAERSLAGSCGAPLKSRFDEPGKSSGVVRNGRPASEPHNLAKGWVKFDFEAAFGCPVKMINDAAMQALKLTRVPAGCRVGNNAFAFVGDFRLWEKKAEQS